MYSIVTLVKRCTSMREVGRMPLPLSHWWGEPGHVDNCCPVLAPLRPLPCAESQHAGKCSEGWGSI